MKKCRVSLKLAFVLFDLLSLALAGCAGKPAPSEPYAPQIDPANFVEVVDNPYFPLIPGTGRLYEGKTSEGLERIEVVVLTETRLVMGVKTVVVRDTVTLDGVLVEETYDWYAQDSQGNVWYFGEEVNNYENGVLKDHSGSWEAGMDDALPGIIMHANPASQVGKPYRQEYYAGEAEDMAEILSVSESLELAFGSFEQVVKTRDWTPLEPGVEEHKFYAPGVGLVKEVNPKTGESIELIEFVIIS